VVKVEKTRNAYKILVGELLGKTHFEDQEVDAIITL
jgi:hypothetical protein